MLATDRFLLISIGRTGTGSLHKWLQEVPGLQIISNVAHEPYRIMAQKCLESIGYVPPAWTIIRNPWDYYVDKWCWERDKGPCFDGSFKEFLAKTILQPSVEGYFYSLTQKWDDLGAYESSYIAKFEKYDRDCLNVLSWYLRGILNREAIIGYMQTNRGYGSSFTADGKPQWEQKSYQEYYDDETRDWVYELDGELIERFGYDFLEGPV